MTRRAAPVSDRRSLGQYGEELAARYLTDAGFTVLDRNWRDGRRGELDIVALSPARDCTVAVEVKTRRSTGYGPALEAITEAKARRLRQLAVAWCRAHDRRGGLLRIDAIGVQVCTDAPPRITHLEGITG
ncbi:YraN family protein [Dermacoccaceae bacterium W4C1]